ncbi:hypothetical protein VHEMI07509 [[Torrubiella] hemipterigena]|uniref:Major facilitator superfamily (MFS) profile domain-containing protein n=1 Tax=[Torrubiella] hemipterigena TaxID=1531966 RepID=A0A0A1TAM6_9HYPO|nr:hypothetical protein VHEMI07509 [[Torrubiella] hemipterigena]
MGLFKKNKSDTPIDAQLAAQKSARTKYRWKLILGLFGPFALQSFDTTVIASALGTIAVDFDQLNQFNWIISSFNLTSTASFFFWAQIADVFGRHVAIQASIIIMMIGSAICTGAPTSSFGALLLGRAIQGIGCSGVNICVRTILADKVSLEEFAANWTIFVLISGVSFGIGPLVGGYLTEVSWRWCFAINLPICAASMLLVVLVLRKELLGPQPIAGLDENLPNGRRATVLRRLSTIDYGGQILFLCGIGLLVLALTWAGGSYSWGSAHVLAPLIIGAALTVVWIFYEREMAPGRHMSRVFPRQKAMMPWAILTQRENCLTFGINMTSGMAIYAIMYFLSLYFTLVDGQSSRDAGLQLLYYMPGLTVGVYTAVFATKRWPRQTYAPLLLGAVITAVAITVLTWAVHEHNNNVVYAMMALVGYGVMLRMNPAAVHALAYFPDMTARITCLTTFALPFGGLFGLTLMSTVFNNKTIGDHEDPKTAIMWAFVSLIPFMWMCVLFSVFLGNVWIGQDGGHEALEGSYLWQLITRKTMVKTNFSRTDATVELHKIETADNRV